MYIFIYMYNIVKMQHKYSANIKCMSSLNPLYSCLFISSGVDIVRYCSKQTDNQ